MPDQISFHSGSATTKIMSTFILSLVSHSVLPIFAAELEKISTKGCETFGSAIGYGMKSFLPNAKVLFFLGTRHDNEQPVKECIEALVRDKPHQIFLELGVSGQSSSCSEMSNQLLEDKHGRKCVGWNSPGHAEERVYQLKKTISFSVLKFINEGLQYYKKALENKGYSEAQIVEQKSQNELFDKVMDELISNFNLQLKAIPKTIRDKIKDNNYQLKLFSASEEKYWMLNLHLKEFRKIRKKRMKNQKSPTDIIYELMAKKIQDNTLAKHAADYEKQQIKSIETQQTSMVNTLSHYARRGMNFVVGGMAHFFKPEETNTLRTSVTNNTRVEVEQLCHTDDTQCVVLKQMV